MRVAYFTESLYPLVDGVSRTLARLFASLEERGIEFTVFSPFVPAPDIPWHDRVQRASYVHFPPYPDYRVSIPRLAPYRRALQEFRPDLIHVVSPTPLAYRAQTLAEEMRVPVVASFHTHFVSYFHFYGIGRFESVGWSLLRRFYRRCARIYVPSESIIRELREQGMANMELWSRGIDLGGFSPSHRDRTFLQDKYGIGADEPVLLLVSRLVKEKDLADLVKVDERLRARGVAYRFALVGDGPLRPTLERALPHAIFAGHQAGKELARWYASADVFVFPSTTETLGNVVLESLASETPAVVVDRGGPQDLIRHGETGYVARANDADDISRYLQTLLEDAELRERMGRAGRESASSRDWEEINGGLIDSYERVIAETRAGTPIR